MNGRGSTGKNKRVVGSLRHVQPLPAMLKKRGNINMIERNIYEVKAGKQLQLSIIRARTGKKVQMTRAFHEGGRERLLNTLRMIRDEVIADNEAYQNNLERQGYSKRFRGLRGRANNLAPMDVIDWTPSNAVYAARQDARRVYEVFGVPFPSFVPFGSSFVEGLV